MTRVLEKPTRENGSGFMRSTLFILTVAILAATAGASFAQQSTEAEGEGGLMAQQDPLTRPTPVPTAPNPVVLRVNGDPIYAFEISMIMQTIQGQLTQRGEKVEQTELAKVATQRAIEQKLLAQEARRFGIEPDEMQVARAAQGAEQQAGGRQALETGLKSAGASHEQFLNVIREIELLRVFIEGQIEPNVKVSDEEIAAFYNDNPELFDAEERAHAYHMIFIIGEDAPADKVAPVREKAEAARQRAATGEEDFASVARELSEGPSAPAGGDLGWVNRGALVSPLSEAIFALEPGQVSEVVRSRFGFHVATVTERRPAGVIGLEEASDQIANAIRQQKTTDTVGQLLEKLIETAKVDNLLGGSGSAVGPGTGGN